MVTQQFVPAASWLLMVGGVRWWLLSSADKGRWVLGSLMASCTPGSQALEEVQWRCEKQK